MYIYIYISLARRDGMCGYWYHACMHVYAGLCMSAYVYGCMYTPWLDASRVSVLQAKPQDKQYACTARCACMQAYEGTAVPGGRQWLISAPSYTRLPGTLFDLADLLGRN